MDFLYALSVLVGTVMFVVHACVWMVRQRRRRRCARELVVSPLSGLAMGAVLLGFQAILNPDTLYVITEEIKEHADEDESGAEPPGGWLFHRQLRQIRRGIEVQQIVVKIAAPADESAHPSDRKSPAMANAARSCSDTT